MQDDTRYCRDCRYYMKPEDIDRQTEIRYTLSGTDMSDKAGNCELTQQTEIPDLVTGESRTHYNSCKYTRRWENLCGKEGNWFERREETKSFWQRLKSKVFTCRKERHE